MTTTKCPSCGTEHAAGTLAKALYICPRCGTYLHIPARERIAMLADPRTFKELDRGLVSVDPLRFTDQRSYRDRLAEARPATGAAVACRFGAARPASDPAVPARLNFRFMGRAVGTAVRE